MSLTKTDLDAIENLLKRHVSDSESSLKGSMFALETRLSGEIADLGRRLDKTEGRLNNLEGQVEALHNDVKEIYNLI